MSIFYSFVLPAYKSTFFKESIDSILTQTYANFELIIVNDASPDDLDTIINSYSDTRIRYYKNEKNIGGTDLVAQWNHCLEYAKGEYVILASDDDKYFPEYLEKMNALVEKHPNINIFRPRIQRINADGDIIGIEGFLNEHISQIEFAYQLFTKRIYSGIPYYLFKLKSLNEFGGFINFPLAWFSDDATTIYLSNNGIVSCPEVLFSFRLSGESITTKVDSIETLTKKIISTNKFYDWFTLFLKNIKVNNPNEVFYKNDLLNTITTECLGRKRALLYSTNLKVIIKNFYYIKTLGYFKVIDLLKILVRKVISL